MKTNDFWRSKRIFLITSLCLQCGHLFFQRRQSEIPLLLYTELRKLGGIYVKFLQLLVLQSEIFQSLREYDLYDVYDQAVYDQIDIHRLLASELGLGASSIEIANSKPFAAGSFGQVYRARYQEKDIVVKVLRPSVIQMLGFDLRILGWLSRVIDMLSMGGAIKTTQVYREMARATRAETNYILEADYASTLYERYRYHPHLFIPFTFRNISTKHVICQEYVGGVSATDVLRMRKQGVDAEEYVRQITGSDLHTQLVAFGIESLTSVFTYGTTYGDPHPGNVKFLAGNKVGLIDYGLQAPAPKNMSSFYRLVEQYHKIYQGQFDMRSYSHALLEMYGGDVVKAAYSLDAYFESNLRILDNIVAMAEQTLNKQGGRTRYLLENNKMLALFGTVINKNNRFCLQYEMDSPEFMRAANLYIALVNELGVKKEVLKETYEIVWRQISQIGIDDTVATLHPEAALEILAGWLDQVSYKNPQLHRKIMQGGMSYV